MSGRQRDAHAETLGRGGYVMLGRCDRAREQSTLRFGLWVTQDLAGELVDAEAAGEGDGGIAGPGVEPVFGASQVSGQHRGGELSGRRDPHRQSEAREAKVEAPGVDELLVQRPEVDAACGIGIDQAPLTIEEGFDTFGIPGRGLHRSVERLAGFYPPCHSSSSRAMVGFGRL
jgi:hypothetical protein